MQAWRVRTVGEPAAVLELDEVSRPEPGPGQLRVRVVAAGIGLPDVLMCRGTYPLTPRVPFTPGQEVAGVVAAVGGGTGFAVGDEVMAVTMFPRGYGSFADECLVAADTAYPVPAGLTPAQAAGFWIPHLTAWTGLVDRGGLGAGEDVAVLGAAGGSGIAAVQLARARGARVIAVAGGEGKLEFCRSLGADDVVDHRTEDVVARLRALTDGRGVDVVFDPVGGALAEAVIGALAPGGRLLLVGFASGRWPSIPVVQLVAGNTSAVGVIAAGSSREHLERVHAELSAMVADGRLRDAVSAELAFTELPAGLQAVAGRSVVGKTVMVR